MSYRHKHIGPKIKHLRRGNNLLKRRWFWVTLITVIVVIFLGYFLLFFSGLQVTEVTISGSEKNKSEDIKTLALNDINRTLISIPLFHLTTKSIIFLDSKKITRDILNQFSGVREVTVKRKWFQRVLITVKERQPVAIFCGSAKECFSIDDRGIIFDQLADLSKEMMVFKKGDDSFQLSAGQKIIEPDIIEAVLRIEKELKDNFQIGVAQVLIANPLIVTTSEGWKLYFGSVSDIPLEITKMKALLKDKITPEERQKLQYIYLQYQDRAYYK